ncbi:hypothetical protein BGZ61DRAFT_321092, partial [Ilyonectria robusta]|uniref:uncharacterized protein n=1 Tax=Ilyonectria robusta TaxID=1079257 RepID=UPI001E8E822D
LIYDYRKPDTAGPGIDIIVVPSAWAQHSPGQVKSGCSWLKPLLQSDLKDTRVFLFTYALQTDGSSLWDQLLSQGTSLVAGLRQSRTQPEALALGNDSREAYQEAVSGIIFLGTPHLVSTSADGWKMVRLLMKHEEREISEDNMTPSEMEGVIRVCRHFENIQLPISIFSIYELKETR